MKGMMEQQIQQKEVKKIASTWHARLIGEYTGLAFLFNVIKSRKTKINKYVKRPVTLFVALCFVLNSVVPDLALAGKLGAGTLAIPSGLDDIAGTQREDMFRIKVAFRDIVTKYGPSVTADVIERNKAILNPEGLQFFFREPQAVPGGALCYRCRIRTSGNEIPRTYFAAVYPHKNADGVFPVSIYTEEDYRKFGGFARGLPDKQLVDTVKSNARFRQYMSEKSVEIAEHEKAEKIAEAGAEAIKGGKVEFEAMLVWIEDPAVLESAMATLEKFAEDHGYGMTDSARAYLSGLLDAIRARSRELATRRTPGGQFAAHPGKSPDDLLRLIAKCFPLGEVITAPNVLKAYKKHYNDGEFRFEAPAADDRSALRTVERDLFESDHSLFARGILFRDTDDRLYGEYKLTLTPKGIALMKKAAEGRNTWKANAGQMLVSMVMSNVLMKQYYFEKRVVIESHLKAEEIKQAGLAIQQASELEIAKELADVTDADMLKRSLAALEGKLEKADDKKFSESVQQYIESQLKKIRTRIRELEELAEKRKKEPKAVDVINSAMAVLENREILDGFRKSVLAKITDYNVLRDASATIKTEIKKYYNEKRLGNFITTALLEGAINERLITLLQEQVKQKENGVSGSDSYGRDRAGKFTEHPGKSPRDVLKVIALYLQDERVITAPKVFEAYRAHYEDLGFEKPAASYESALKTVERDLFAGPDSLERSGILKRMAAAGARGAYQYIVTAEGKKLVTEVQSDASKAPRQRFVEVQQGLPGIPAGPQSESNLALSSRNRQEPSPVRLAVPVQNQDRVEVRNDTTGETIGTISKSNGIWVIQETRSPYGLSISAKAPGVIEISVTGPAAQLWAGVVSDAPDPSAAARNAGPAFRQPRGDGMDVPPEFEEHQAAAAAAHVAAIMSGIADKEKTIDDLKGALVAVYDHRYLREMYAKARKTAYKMSESGRTEHYQALLAAKNALMERMREINAATIAAQPASDRLAKAKAGMGAFVSGLRNYADETPIWQPAPALGTTDANPRDSGSAVRRDEMVDVTHKKIASVAAELNLTAAEKAEFTNWVAQELGHGLYGREIQIKVYASPYTLNDVADYAYVDEFEEKAELNALLASGLEYYRGGAVQKGLVEEYLKKAGELTKDMSWGSALLDYYRSRRYLHGEHPAEHMNAFRYALAILMTDNDATFSPGAKWIIEQEFLNRERISNSWKEFYGSVKDLAGESIASRLNGLEDVFLDAAKGIVLQDGNVEQPPQPRTGNGRYARRPGKNSEDALMVIALSEALHKKPFDLSAYIAEYKKVADTHTVLKFDQKISRSTANRDLRILNKDGILRPASSRQLLFEVNPKLGVPAIERKKREYNELKDNLVGTFERPASRALGDEIISMEGARKEEILRKYAAATKQKESEVVAHSDDFRVTEFGDGNYVIEEPASARPAVVFIPERNGGPRVYDAIVSGMAVRDPKTGRLSENTAKTVSAEDKARGFFKGERNGIFTSKVGKNQVDARTVIALSDLMAKGPFNREDYKNAYKQVAKDKKYSWLGFEPDISDSTVARDLAKLRDALLLIEDVASTGHIYYFSSKGRDEFSSVRDGVLQIYVDAARRSMSGFSNEEADLQRKVIISNELYKKGYISREAYIHALKTVKAVSRETELYDPDNLADMLGYPNPAPQGGKNEIAEIAASASAAGLMIPTHPSERYTLLVTSEFYKNNEEFKSHQEKYGDRFDLNSVSGVTFRKFIDNVLEKAKARGIENRTIALVPDDVPQEELERLKKAGIRFIRVNAVELLKAKHTNDSYRMSFQLDTYVMMLLARRIDKDMPRDSSIYRVLSFYLRSHFNLAGGIAVDDYINAIVNGDVTKLILGILAYRPVQAYDTKADYDNVATALISA